MAGRLCFDTCLSVCLRGVLSPGPARGYPNQVQLGGTSDRSSRGVPQPGGTSAKGVAQPRGTPGYPPQPGQDERYQGYPSGQVRTMGVPPPQDRTAHGVLDTPRSVCLLRSRRRTFLFFDKTKTKRFVFKLKLCKNASAFFLMIFY